MAGIYVHIPFCKKACHYCNFHFSVSLKSKNGFIAALLNEISLQKNYLKDEDIDTIYFGGGTPSLLEKEDLEQICRRLNDGFNIVAGAEITLEANPDDITPERLENWKAVGINRLSIGIQSFFEDDLQWMNRAHNAVQAKECIVLAREAGFHNFSIDLIYGTPGLTDAKWSENVATALALNIPHLSCYALTVEPGTALKKMISQPKTEDVDTEKQARHFLLLMDWLQQAGYEHYEISNFAKPGYRSRHNSSYWQRKKYLGVGPSAHSFDGISRQWNIANNALYIQSLEQNKIPFEEEKLTDTQRLNEYIMTALRTQEGLDLIYTANNFGEKAAQQLQKASGKYIAGEKLV
ncbi:MAG: radical SAM family heme chaperone HemW, partial [Bacteroidota bacterium]